MNATSSITLEPAAQKVAEAFSQPPFLYERAPADARKVLEDAQSAPADMLPVDEEWITVPAPVGDVRVRIIRPPGATAAMSPSCSSRCTTR
jgi:acetyl esterase